MKIAVFGDRETVFGFKLAGVSKSFEVTKNLDISSLDLSEVSLVIVNEKFGKKVRSALSNEFIIVEIPDKGGEISKDMDLAQKLAKHAIGVKLNN